MVDQGELDSYSKKQNDIFTVDFMEKYNLAWNWKELRKETYGSQNDLEKIWIKRAET